MIRFILEYVETREELGGTRREMFTIDADMPELEAQLTRGGCGEMGSEYVRFVGIEVNPRIEEPTK